MSLICYDGDAFMNIDSFSYSMCDFDIPYCFSAWNEDDPALPSNINGGKFTLNLTNGTIPLVHAKLVIAGKEYETDRALIDTGASDCMVFSSFISNVNASPCGLANMQTSNGPSAQSPAYEADLFLPAGISVRGIKVIWSKSKSKVIDVVIGHSVLSHGVFSYDGIRKTFSFEI